MGGWMGLQMWLVGVGWHGGTVTEGEGHRYASLTNFDCCLLPLLPKTPTATLKLIPPR